MSAVPNTGYSFVSWSDGVASPSRTDVNVTASKSVTANFTLTHIVTFAAGMGGKLTGTTPQTVLPGASCSAMTAVPNTNYHFVNWTGSVTSTDNPLTVTNVQSNLTVTANFSPTYIVTFAAGAGGTITGTTSQNVYPGTSCASVTAVPNANYRFVNWTGGVTSTDNPLTMTNVQSDLTVTANFTPAYTVTFAAGAGGTLTGTTPQTVLPGASCASVTAVPTTNYRFVNWTGGITSTDNPLTVANVQSNLTITANFAINTYTLTYTAWANGSVTGISPQTVNHGASGSSVSAVPNTGCFFTGWSDGVASPSRTDSNVTASKSVTAYFTHDFTYAVAGSPLVATITGYIGAGGAVAIPSTLDGYPVVSIGERAFAGCTSLTSVTIPSSVTSIGERAFSGTGLTSVSIPNSVTSIGEGAFAGCSSLMEITVDTSNSAFSSLDGVLFSKDKTMLAAYPGGKVGPYTIPSNVTIVGNSAFSSCTSLTSVTIPSSVISIGNYAFSSTGLINVSIPSSVTSIREGAFSDCTSLISVTIPNSVISIANGAFYGCISLTSVTIPNSVTSIGEDAFWGCSSLASVTIPSSVTNIGDCAFLGCTTLTSVTIPNSVTSIGNNLFSGCSSLTSVTIPPTVTSIGEGAFADCTGLTSITIPSSVTSIGNNVFNGCAKLTAIKVDASNSVYSSLDGVLFDKNQTSLVQCPGGKLGFYTIPSSVTSIGNCAFSGCTSLTNVLIPNNVTSIGDWAFSSCSSLTNMTIPSSVTNIEEGTFCDCTGLTGVTIPNSVISIGDIAFNNCSRLTSVTIPNSVTSIGWVAFFECAQLTAANFLGNAPTMNIRVFDNAATGFKIWYDRNKTGWTNPWYGYPTAAMPIITASAGANGAISPEGAVPVPYDVSQTFTMTPAANYHVADVLVDGLSVGAVASYDFKNVKADHTISVAFAINSYLLTYTAGANGTISGITPQTVIHGASGLQVTAVPNTGYHFVKWNDGVATASRTDATVTASVNVTAEFTINTYTLTYTAGANGSITGTSPQSVNYGANGTVVTAVPETGYHFVNWTKADGSEYSKSNPLTVSNVTGDLAVTANFAINTYTVSFASGGNGSLTGTASQTVNHGASCTAVTAVLAIGYHFVNWTGGVNSTDNPLTVTNVQSNMTITANFAINTYKVKFAAAANGTVNGAVDQTVTHGSDASAVTANGNEHYHFVNWTGDVSSVDNPLTIKNVVKDMSVTANFAIDQVLIKATAGVGGKIEPAGDVPMDYGSNKSFIFTADAGYRVSLVLVDSVSVEAVKSYTFSNVTAPHVIGVTFIKTDAALTMASTGDGVGTVSPSGISTVKTGIPVSISALAERGSFFGGWIVSGNGVVANPNGKDTTVTLTGDATVTATFSKAPVKAEAVLSFATNPAGTGTTSPSGSQTVKTDNPVAVSATAATGYAFAGWTASSPSAWIADAASPATVVRIYDDTTITASFKTIPTEAVLTMKARPVDGGTVSPSGSGIQKTGADIALKATPATGYSFLSWEVSGPAVVLNEGVEETVVRISGDTTVTAVFTTEPPVPNVRLTMAVTPDDTGTTYPAAGMVTTMRKGTVKTVAAVPADGFVFLNWELSGELYIEDSSLATTDVTVEGDATLTAVFAAAQPMVATVSFTSNHTEKAGKKDAGPTSTDTYTITYKATLPADFPLPAKDEMIPLGITFGDFVFMDSTENADKKSYDAKKGGSALFYVKPDGATKPYDTITFKWTAKRQLLITVKGTPPIDPDCMVTNIVDLTGETAGKKSGNVSPCSFLFSETEFSAPVGTAVPWTGTVKLSKDSLLTSWTVKGSITFK